MIDYIHGKMKHLGSKTNKKIGRCWVWGRDGEGVCGDGDSSELRARGRGAAKMGRCYIWRIVMWCAEDCVNVKKAAIFAVTPNNIGYTHTHTPTHILK